MTTATLPAPRTSRPATTPGSTRSLAAYHGTGRMLRLVLRRNWLRLSIWTIVLVGMVPLVFASQKEAFPTQESRDAYAKIANTPAVAALTGLPHAADTLGGILNIKIWMTLAVAIAFAAAFLVTRNGRAEEEAGRTELLRAGRLGHHAYFAATLAVVSAFTILVGALIALVCIGLGLPADGSVTMGASITGTGLVFMGVAALTGQLSSSGRGANGFASAVIGIAYLIRAAGDLNSTEADVSGLVWASPIGWAQQMRSFGDNNWWPFLLLVATTVVLVGISITLESRRDLGDGLVAERAGRARASAFTRSPLGLAIRLQRGSLVGWTLGVVALGVIYGSVVSSMSDLIAPDNPIYQDYIGGADNALDGLLGLLLLFTAMVVAAFAVQSALLPRNEEASGRIETQLTGSISRTRWALSKLAVTAVGSALLLAIGGATMGASYGRTIDDPSQVARLTGAALVHWPAVMVIAGVVVLGFGWWPRLASGIGWAVMGISSVVALFGGVLGLPDALIDWTPLALTPELPGEPMDWGPVLLLTAVAIVFWVLGLQRFGRRDLTGE